MSHSCPQCASKAFKRNGYTRHGKQNHRCLDCGRQFSLEPAYIVPELCIEHLLQKESNEANSHVCQTGQDLGLCQAS